MPGGAWRTAAVLVVAGLVSPVAAQPLPPAAPQEPLPPAAAPVRGSAIPDHPPPILGAPIAVRGEAIDAPTTTPPTPRRTVPESATPPTEEHDSTPVPRRTPRTVGLGAPTVAGQDSPPTPVVVPAGATEPAARKTADSPPADDPVNELLTKRSGYKDRRDPPPRKTADGPERSSWKFGDRLAGIIGDRGEWFKSDHAFDGFASPVTNPFLFEDPRSLTELRPLYIYQSIPGRQPDTGGGNVSFFGTQARVAITTRLSFTINKLGGTWFSPERQTPFEDSTGFSEVWLGPKFTFIRNEETGSLLAGGLQFQVPIGSKGVFQDTGSLSLVPYVTYGQNFFRDARFGSFNTLASAGYALSTSSARTDYLFLSGHLDWDVMNWHRFYPLVEMNYVLNTSDGNARALGSEGRDLFNAGGQANGNGLLTGAIGARFKITEHAQFGAAFEFPLAGPRDFFDTRFTVDFILRY